MTPPKPVTLDPKDKAIADEFREELKKAAHQHLKEAAADPVVNVPIPIKPEAPVTQAQAAGYWARFMASQLGRAMRTRWIILTWPIAKRIAVLKCRLGYHDWEDAANILPDGSPDTKTPGLFKRCKRPACRIYRDMPQLKVVRNPSNGAPVWFEVSDQFEVIARAGCKLCQGRGYSKRMLLPSEHGYRVTAQVPCECLRVQPRFIKREKVKR